MWLLPGLPPPTAPYVATIPLPPLLTTPAPRTRHIVTEAEYSAAAELYKHYDSVFAKAWKRYNSAAVANIPEVARSHDGGHTFLRMHQQFFAAANPPLPDQILSRNKAPGQVAWHKTHAFAEADLPSFRPTKETPFFSSSKELKSYKYDG